MNKSKRDKQKNKGNKRKISSKTAVTIAAFLLVSGNAWANYQAGSYASATNSWTTAVGEYANASAGYATAVGYSANASGTYGSALGYNANATASGTVAVGVNANATSGGAIAIGNTARSYGSQSIAIGESTNIAATVSESVALGHSSSATENYTVSVGNSNTKRRIVNMADGTAANDATTVNQLNNAISVSGGTVTLKDAAGTNKATVYTTGQTTTLLNAKVNGGTYTAGNYNLAIGNSTVNGNHTLAIGNSGGTRAKAEQAIAIGNNAYADGGYSVALGVDAKTAANTNYGVAIGKNANAGGNYSVAVGSAANANNSYSQAFGYNAQVLGAYSMALGGQTSIANTVNYAVALGYGSSATENYTVSVGSSTIKRRITNVNNGTANNDATTVSQLNSAIVANNTAGTVALKDAAGTTTKATVYTSTKADKMLNDAIVANSDAGTVALKDAAGTTTKATVYTSAEVDKKLKAQDTAALKTRLDTVQQVVKNDTANATVIRGGTGTTALQLTDQDKAGANTQSGANLGTTMYANGVEQTANLTDAAYITLGGTAATDPNTNTVSSTQAVDGLVYYTASNKPTGTPANAIGVMRETVGGEVKYKYITGTRLSGVAQGVNANDAVNKAQLDTGLSKKVDAGTIVGTGADNLAVGTGSTAGNASNAAQATAVGKSAKATGTQSTALGSATQTSGVGSVALGYGSIATENNTVSVGNSTTRRRIINVANGTAANDATTVGQVNGLVTIDPNVDGVSPGTVTLKDDLQGTTSAKVYTSAQTDKVVQSKIDTTVGKAAEGTTAATGLFKTTSDNAAALTKLNTTLKTDTTETTLRGGTGTTIQTLRDQDKGVAAGTGNSGVNYQTTMYGAGGDNNAEFTTTQANFDAFTNSGTLPTDAPTGATGIINEGGEYKYVTNTRLGGVAAGVKNNDAVNYGQLKSVTSAVGTASVKNNQGQVTKAATGLTATVESNTNAIGTASVKDKTTGEITQAATGLTAKVETAQAGVDTLTSTIGTASVKDGQGQVTKAATGLTATVESNTNAIGTASVKDGQGRVTKAATGLTAQVETAQADIKTNADAIGTASVKDKATGEITQAATGLTAKVETAQAGVDTLTSTIGTASVKNNQGQVTKVATGLTATVESNTNAIGTASVKDKTTGEITQAATGLTAKVETAQAGVDTLTSTIGTASVKNNQGQVTKAATGLTATVESNTNAIGTASVKDGQGQVTKAATGLTATVESNTNAIGTASVKDKTTGEITQAATGLTAQVETAQADIKSVTSAIGTASVTDKATGKITQAATGLYKTIDDSVATVNKKVTNTRRMVKQVNEHLGLGGKRGTTAKDTNTVVLSASRTLTTTGTAADSADTATTDAIAGAAVVLSNTKAAMERADGVEAIAATNTETVLKGGTGTTVQTLRDQDKGVAAGKGKSGVNYQTTMYGAGGDNNAEYTTTQANFDAFVANGALSTDAPAGATGIINEGGVYKYVTDVRLGGVAAGVNANDAVNKAQLDTGLSKKVDAGTIVGTGAGNLAVGTGSTAGSVSNVVSATAVGIGAQATSYGSTALGTNAQASGIGSVALGIGSKATEDNTVSVGNSGTKRRITNVANGTADQDAATIAQLNSIVTIDKDANNQATGTVTLKDATGSESAQVYTSAEVDKKIQAQDSAALKTRLDTVQQVVKTDTASATVIRGGTGTTALQLNDQDKAGANTQSGANLGTTIYDANGVEQIANLTDADYIALGGTTTTSGTNTVSSTQAVDGLVYYTASNKPTTAPANAIGVMRETVGGVVKYKYITGTRISGVATGVNANDAVNVKQLSDALNNISGGSLEGLSTEINDRKAADAALNQRINRNRAAIDRNSQGIANTAAIAGMAPLPNGAESGLTLGLSQYSGMQGLAIGYLHRLNESFTVKAAMATGNTGQPVSTLGLAYTWGGNSSDRITSHALQVRLHSTASELAQAKAEREQAKIKAERMQNKVTTARAEATEAKGQAQAAKAEAAAAKAQANEAKAKADKLEAALAQAQAMQAELLRRMSAVESKQLLKK